MNLQLPATIVVACVALLTASCQSTAGPSVSGPAASPRERLIVVSPSGDDGGAGTEASPFRTPARALAAVAESRATDASLPVRVLFEPGEYELAEALALGPEHSGSPDAPVVFASSDPARRALLSGGSHIEGWTVGPDGWWRVTLPDVAAGRWAFSQLFVDGERRLRPKLPREGCYAIAAEPAGAHDALHYDGDAIRADWSNLGDIEVLVFHTWSTSRMRIKSVDAAARVATLTTEVPNANAAWSGLRKGRRFFLDNVRYALGSPGEWYLDRPSGELTYIPLPGETPDKARVVAPRLDHLVRLEGAPLEGRWVEFVRFEDLDLAHTNFVLPAEGYGCAQAEAQLGGAVLFDGARDCALAGCSISRVATYAVQMNAASWRNRVEGCALVDMGAGGVQIGAKLGGWWFENVPGGKRPRTTEMLGGGNVVEGCLIAHGGRQFPAAVGVWIGDSPLNRIVGNEITDLFYTGVSPGWVWGYARSYAHHNLIEGNHIHDLGQRVLSDMGGIYTLGISPGTVLRGNHIHDVYSYDYGGWGIYFDEGSTNVLAENNLVHGVKDGGFHQHYGRENYVWNNIFAFSEQAQVKRSRVEEHRSFEFRRNIVYWNGDAPLLGGSFQGENFEMDGNLYWKEGGGVFDFAGQTFDQWKARGQDVHSIIADPQFADPASGDFTLAPGTPARALGFSPFDPPGDPTSPLLDAWRARPRPATHFDTAKVITPGG